MPERSLLLTGPVPLGGGPLLDHLGALVAADVLVRRARAEGRNLPWVAAALAGGLAGQRSTVEDLVREGLDRSMLAREEFVARSDALADEGRRLLASLVTGLGLGLDVDAAASAGEAAATAARTAFVRLFDAGLVVRADRVLGVCPSCATAVAASDAVAVELDGEVLTLRLTLLDGADDAGRLEVRCLAPELLPGVVAVAVPEGSPAAGTTVLVPVAASVVPVVADPSVGEPTLVVPAHDPAALELARRLGLTPVTVFDAGGMVCSPGPLAGLARYAARAAAKQLLGAERALVATVEQPEQAERCPACRSVLIPVLGRQWFLTMGELETAAADAVRDGRVVVFPAAAREDVLARGGGGDWCLSQQLWAGVPVPMGRCLDCGRVDVSVHPDTSCGSCMGDLVPADDVLDARFVRCVWPLAVAGWPETPRLPGERTDGPTLLVMAAHVADEILAMIALGLRLSGAVPFDEVAVVPLVDGRGADRPPVPGDMSALLAEEGPAVVRVALTCGGLDVPAARDLVARLDDPPAGRADVDRLAAAVTGAFAAAAPASALGLLAAAVGEGVPAGDAERVQVLAAPFVGG